MRSTGRPLTLRWTEFQLVQPQRKLVHRLPSGKYVLDLSQLPQEVQGVSLLRGDGPEGGVPVASVARLALLDAESSPGSIDRQSTSEESVRISRKILLFSLR